MALDLMRRTDNAFTFMRNDYLASVSPSRYNPHLTGGPGNFSDPTEDVVCATVFRRHVVLLSLEVGKWEVMEIVKDVKVTFSDMLGTIGDKCTLSRVWGLV